MLLNFYVQGSSSSKSAPSADGESDRSYLESLSSLTLDQSIGYGKEKLESIMESAKRAFRYLSGDVTQLPTPHPQLSAKEDQANRGQDKGLWSLAGLFSGLKGRRSIADGAGDSGVLWTEGEVHADLVRVCNFPNSIFQCSVEAQNDDGYFVFRYLLIDIPSKPLIEFMTFH